MDEKIRINTIICLLIFILIVATTYPLIFKINTCIPGFFSTDESIAIVWNAWFIKFSLLNHISIKTTDFIAYPFGIDFYTNRPTSYIWVLINFILPVLTTPVLTYNLQIIFNLFLSVLFTIFLMYYLTKNRTIALFSGVIFGFCPYMFVRSWQHLGETYLWPMPLFLWFLFRLKEDKSLITKIIFVVSLILAAINYDVIYYVFIILVAFLIYLMPKWKSNKLYINKIFLLSTIASVMLIPQFFSVFKNLLFPMHSTASAHNPYFRPFEDLFTQSAKPLSYLLPSVAHPIFGKFTEQFIGTQLYGISFTEHMLYLGWVPLILAFVAFRKWRKRRREAELGTVPFGDSPHYKEDFYIGFFILLVIVAWLFSQPPWWKLGSLKIYMPSYFMYKILPMFRAYCRFGIVVMLAVSVLAGFGLKFVLERFKTQRAKIAVTTLFCGLVLFEFWNYPPFKVIDVSKVPAVYYWLKEQPGDFVIAEYPLDIIGPNEMYKFYQTAHEKKIINGTIPGSYAHKVAQKITKLSSPETARILKWMGVKYALVHRDGYLGTDLVEDREELEKIPQNKGLKFVRSFPVQECPDEDIMCVQKTGPIDVYEVR